ncbi:hypothetical protein MMC18_002724 [Xylographa bjoerkii]|nr:hypothetical protein [Xylographa bjoerkii]
MPHGFKKCIIALTGDFDKPYERIKKWIEIQGGEFTSKIDSNVTHLVSSKDHFKKSVAMVQQARKLKKCKIVSWDWLEDSLLAKRPLRVGDFLLKGQVKAKVKAKATRKETRDDNIKKGSRCTSHRYFRLCKLISGVGLFEKGCDEFKNKMYTDGYHIYRDSTGFGYDITLARSDLTTNTNARYFLKVSSFPYTINLFTPLYPYTLPRRSRVPLPAPRTQCLQLYESHVSPSKYACFSSYSSPTAGTATHVLAPLGSTFTLAMGQFTQFFKLKTKLEWKERNGTLDMESENAFVYTPPAEGEPWGVVDPESIW